MAGENARIVVRMGDGRCYAVALAEDGAPGRMLVRGGQITGPAGAPFGFYRRTPDSNARSSPPPNLAADPLATIATVQAVDRAYRVTLLGMETIDTRSTYHLKLEPLREPDAFPLRALWVDAATSEVLRLTYEQPFNAGRAFVQYSFAEVGLPPAWVIVHISAKAGRESVSQDLRDITFPQSEPEENFEPPSPGDKGGMKFP